MLSALSTTAKLAGLLLYFAGVGGFISIWGN